ncbi:hypothetical protein, partial [Cupriavidus metallidurans]
ARRHATLVMDGAAADHQLPCSRIHRISCSRTAVARGQRLSRCLGVRHDNDWDIEGTRGDLDSRQHNFSRGVVAGVLGMFRVLGGTAGKGCAGNEREQKDRCAMRIAIAIERRQRAGTLDFVWDKHLNSAMTPTRS